MKNIIIGVLFLFSYQAVLAAPVADLPRPDVWGVYSWANWKVHKINKDNAPNIKGSAVIMHWKNVEPRKGEYQWDEQLGEKLKAAIKNDFYVHIMLWVGPLAPEWIYDEGVPKVETDRQVNALGHKTNQTAAPYYFSPVYKKLFFNLIKEFGAYVNSLPKELQERIIFIQSAEGSTGDGWGYKGKPLEKKYLMTRDEFDEFRVETWAHYNKHFSLPIVVNIDGHTLKNNEKWLFDNLMPMGVKQGMFSHGYHVSENNARIKEWQRINEKAQAAGTYIFARGEMDKELSVMGWSKQNIPEALYWSAIFATHTGIDLWNVPSEQLTKPENQAAFIFFNRYAGQRQPATAQYAFAALRQGLDAGDTKTFPESRFGIAKKKRKERYQKIAEKFAAQGAVQSDIKAAMGEGMVNRKRKGYNDVGWNIPAGNYARFLTQLNPEQTSMGYWHQGPAEQIYGRFARAFKLNNGEGQMSFALHQDFFAQPNTPKDVTVRIVYLDRGKGQWSLDYQQAGNKLQTVTVRSVTVQNQDTGKWRSKEIKLNKAMLNQSLSGADLKLVYQSGHNTLFHLVELNRQGD
ncbi:hypothetical protein [Colwellia piezophila]|uniref:hypothetical protein n=1 Tax=Colwellia piezophila TaxID=211668 RepID=UPI000377997D|nr:hypothetical protein [Colwellia piezophila]